MDPMEFLRFVHPEEAEAAWEALSPAVRNLPMLRPPTMPAMPPAGFRPPVSAIRPTLDPQALNQLVEQMRRLAASAPRPAALPPGTANPQYASRALQQFLRTSGAMAAPAALSLPGLGVMAAMPMLALGGSESPDVRRFYEEREAAKTGATPEEPFRGMERLALRQNLMEQARPAQPTEQRYYRTPEGIFDTEAGEFVKEIPPGPNLPSRGTPPLATIPMPFESEGSGYDYPTAQRTGMKPQEGHWGSVAPTSPEEKKRFALPDESYTLLKGKAHPTWDKGVAAEEARGFKVKKIGDRYYSVPQSFGVRAGDVTESLRPSPPRPPEREQSTQTKAAPAQSYVVKKGDSLWKIAEQLLGDATRWQEIQKENPFVGDVRKLQPGTRLRIPGKRARKPARIPKEDLMPEAPAWSKRKELADLERLATILAEERAGLSAT